MEMIKWEHILKWELRPNHSPLFYSNLDHPIKIHTYMYIHICIYHLLHPFSIKTVTLSISDHRSVVVVYLFHLLSQSSLSSCSSPIYFSLNFIYIVSNKLSDMLFFYNASNIIMSINGYFWLISATHKASS